MSGRIKQGTYNVTTLGDNQTNFQTATEQRVSETTDDLGDVEGALHDLEDDGKKTFNTLQSQLSVSDDDVQTTIIR